VSQRLIPTGERSGLQTHIATMESVSLCVEIIGKNMKDLLHVTVGGGDCLRRTAAALTRTQIWRVPIPPVMFGVRLFVVVVVLRRLAEELCKGRDIHSSCSLLLPLRPGRRVVISWSSQRFPSGSSNEANEK
jgi:hypothetical protein